MLDLAEAYDEALKDGAWVERRPGLRLIRLTGPQRVWFLQNTITADVEGAEDGRWVESCFLDPKGRVMAHFRVGFLGAGSDEEGEIWIDADPASGAGLGEWFVKYRFRTKVEIEPVETGCITVFGGDAAAAVPDGGIARIDGAIAFGRTLAGVPTANIHGDYSEAPGRRGPDELYDVLRVETGIGEFGVDFGPADLPQEAGLTRVLSVDKGCYVGQETIARIHFRGHVNRVLRTLTFSDGVPATGSALSWNDAAVGRVTSAVHSPRRGAVGLGMVRVEPPEGARLSVDGGGVAVLGPIPAGTKVKQPAT